MNTSRRLVVFHRHGHRAPASNVFRLSGETAVQAEETLWKQLLADESTHAKLGNSFPIQLHADNPSPRDVASFPFGCLTRKGQMHLEKIGGLFSKRWQHEVKAVDRLHVFATNYQRTQASAQSFLTGLGFLRSTSPHHNSSSSFSSSASAATTTATQVVVRPIKSCAMSFYEGRPHVAEKMGARVRSTQAFVQLEAKKEITEATRLLGSILPQLLKGRYGFDWLAIFDYYLCRRAHSLSTHDEIAGLESLVQQHVVNRYALYFADELHLAHFTLPLLIDLRQSIIAASSPSSSFNIMTIFSGHDVNILGLLYAFECKNIVEKTAYWPEYGCTLVFATSVSSQSVEIFLDQSLLPVATFSLSELTEKINKMQKTIDDVSSRV